MCPCGPGAQVLSLVNRSLPKENIPVIRDTAFPGTLNSPVRLLALSAFLFCLKSGALLEAAPAPLDLSKAVVVSPADAGPLEVKAVVVLREEIAKRTGLDLEATSVWPTDGRPVLAIGLFSRLGDFAGPHASALRDSQIPGPEGFRVVARSEPGPAVAILGKDPRGVFYGVGQFLRRLDWSRGALSVAATLDEMTAPRYPLRGHQLGYRPKTNAYDAWTPEQFDQYIRELALFGSNAIEIIPPVSDDSRTSRHMKVPPMEMMVLMAEIIDSYGMEVWIWYPNVGDDYVSEKGIQKEVEEREEVFRQLGAIDALLVPGGDPGHLHPDVFFPFMDRVATVLRKHHSGARIWVSPQAMQPTREWLASFYRHVNTKPSWLGGVVFAPWIKTPISNMRELVDADLPLRRYPDITHNVACQYPVRDWDLAFALTLHRECFNPRPKAMKAIHNLFDGYANGSITYSEGISDDVNKFIWGDQDWDPERSVLETLRDYARFFISSKHAEAIAHGLLAQELHWEGPLASNTLVQETLAQWRHLERTLPEAARTTYRFEMGLLRAYYDAYIQRRLLHETVLEQQAQDVLRGALDSGGAKGALESLKEAETILARSRTHPVATDLRDRCWELTESLYKSIGAQLTVEKHGAKHRTRGAFMDGIEEPLNNAAWLRAEFRRIREVGNEKKRLSGIHAVLNRTNPGPGGFYDNMGTVRSQRRVVRDIAWEQDPGTLASPRTANYYRVNNDDQQEIPLAWKQQVGVLYETPLHLRYDGLDPNASYRVRVTYTGDRGKRQQLVADGHYTVHEVVPTWDPPVREYPVPRAATADGKLTLTWTCGEGERGSQLSEIWLLRDPPE